MSAEAAAAVFRSGAPSKAWPLLVFALWSLIHLEDATPAEALEALTGTI